MKLTEEERKARRSAYLAAYRIANKEKRAKDAAASYLIKKEHILAVNAIWRRDNLEKTQEIHRAWREKNATHVKEYFAKYRAEHKTEKKLNNQKNKENQRISTLRWRLANPHMNRIYKQNRKAREAGGKLSVDLPNRLQQLQKNQCACCKQSLKSGYHLDHVIALAKGGENIDSNIQLLCKMCNCKKSTKHPVDFMQENGYLL